MAQLAIIAGLGLSYKQTLDEGKQAAKLAKIQQQQLIEQSKSVREAGQFESREKRKEAKRAQASQIAQMAANGGEITGSNLSLLAGTAREFEGDALVISRNFGIRAMELRNKGALVRWQGRLARRSARIRGFANLASGIGTMFLMSKTGSGAPKADKTKLSTAPGETKLPTAGGTSSQSSRSIRGATTRNFREL